MSETEEAATLKQLHRQVERLTSVRGSLAGQLEERRDEVEALEGEAFVLQRRVDELLPGGPGRVVFYLVLVGAAIAAFFIFRHTQVDLYVHAPIPRAELSRLVFTKHANSRYVSHVTFSGQAQQGKAAHLSRASEVLESSAGSLAALTRDPQPGATPP